MLAKARAHIRSWVIDSSKEDAQPCITRGVRGAGRLGWVAQRAFEYPLRHGFHWADGCVRWGKECAWEAEIPARPTSRCAEVVRSYGAKPPCDVASPPHRLRPLSSDAQERIPTVRLLRGALPFGASGTSVALEIVWVSLPPTATAWAIDLQFPFQVSVP
jgi:hypothetical protein